MTTLTAPGRKRPVDRNRSLRRAGTPLTTEQRIAHLADQLWDTVRIVRRMARLEARRAAQTAWLATYGHECPDDDYARRAGLLAATEARWAAARVAFLEAAERCVVAYRMIEEPPWRQIEEAYRVDFRTSGKTEAAYRRQWRWWLEQDWEAIR
jgi:hypothetical protein